MTADPRDRRIAELEAQVAALRAELAEVRERDRRKSRRSAYAARREAAIARGQWRPQLEDAAMVREHIKSVMEAAGLSRWQFAAAAGLDAGTVSKILYAGQRHVRTPVARKALAVTAAVPVPDSGMVHPAGSSRRLQALAVAGCSVALMASRLGMDEGSVRKVRDGDRGSISAATARKIRVLYDELWNTTPPERDRAERIAASKTRAFAAKHAWVPAGAWDDDQIDRPSARPAEGWKRRPDRKYRRAADLAAEAEELSGFGLDRDAAAARLGVTRATLDTALARAARRDTRSGDREAAA